MTTHVMSCFRLPKNVTKKITSTIAHLWWSSSRNKKGIHWYFWDKVCKHKEDGGLCFQDLQEFTRILLAKKLWRLIDKPDCLFSRVFKRQYIRKTDPMDQHKSYASLFGWKYICSARFLVKNWLIKRVGIGQSILVWTDPWISAPRPMSSLPKIQHQLLNHSLKVEHLINQADLSWNTNCSMNIYIQMM